MKIGYFKLAKNVSKYSTVSPKVGAVIARKKPISVGFNKDKPVMDNYSTHAEINAILTAGGRFDDLDGCVIYVYRERNGLPALSRPCDRCMEFIKEKGIKKVFYTINEPPYYIMERL